MKAGGDTEGGGGVRKDGPHGRGAGDEPEIAAEAQGCGRDAVLSGIDGGHDGCVVRRLEEGIPGGEYDNRSGVAGNAPFDGAER